MKSFITSLTMREAIELRFKLPSYIKLEMNIAQTRTSGDAFDYTVSFPRLITEAQVRAAMQEILR